MNLEELWGKRVGFCGADNLTFCIVTPEGERVAFEAVEDPDDGYRSMLEEVKQVKLDGLIFFHTPVVELTVAEDVELRGHKLVDDYGHAWLRMGTDDAEDYYPCFAFTYDPPKELVGCQIHDECREVAPMGVACAAELPSESQVKP